jgi:hypothetical protein
LNGWHGMLMFNKKKCQQHKEWLVIDHQLNKRKHIEGQIKKGKGVSI